MESRLALFPITTQISDDGGELTVAGLSLAALAAQHGTPLYLYDAATLVAGVKAYESGLAGYPGSTGITYAGKAYLSLAMAQWTQRHGLWVDCTGLGELAVAAAADVPRARTLVHGVNKSDDVLEKAVEQAGIIVVDNLGELERIAALAARGHALPDLWLRFRPGETVTTHSHIQTGQNDSKFGMSAAELEQATALCRERALPLRGLHFHLGSQFRDTEPLVAALNRSLDLAQTLQLAREGWALCPGGGLGVAYHERDLPHPDAAAYARNIAERVAAGCRERGLVLPHLQLEPGRSLVARAGVALYRVGAVKDSPQRRWLLIDGGMADNLRHALYQAQYSALPVQEPLRQPDGTATLAGPFCESGDVIIEDLPFAGVRRGELIAVPVSGAYHLSMASNYNGATRPAVLWLEDGTVGVIEARETATDLLRRDRPLPGQVAPLHNVPFSKYQVNGNDYIVARRDDFRRTPTPEEIKKICDRHYGFGSDGLLLDCSSGADSFHLRIFNPDGSEAEKSGNGLSMFTRFLWDTGRIGTEPVTIRTLGGSVQASVHADSGRVTLNMGEARGVGTAAPAIVPETITFDGETFQYCAVSLGNPHCVVLCETVDEALARRWGPRFERAEPFPAGTNVQFLAVRDRQNIAIEIWERGVGYTLASGTSSGASASVAHALGFCGEVVVVHTPGGNVTVTLAPDGTATMNVPVTHVWTGRLR